MITSCQNVKLAIINPQAPVDEWVFVVLKVIQSPQPSTPVSGAELQIFSPVGDELVDVAADTVELPDGRYYKGFENVLFRDAIMQPVKVGLVADLV